MGTNTTGRITKITLKGVASYSKEAILETDKKFNFCYGLNGSGKTILSKYLRNLSNEEPSEKFQDCSIEGFDKTSSKILVYNEDFIKENFYASNVQKGIFTLTKRNKDILEKIVELMKYKTKLDTEISDYEKNLKSKNTAIKECEEDLQEKVWQIKIDYVDRNKVFDDAGFLVGVRGSKAKLVEKLIAIPCSQEPLKDIERIKKEVAEFSDTAPEREHLEKIDAPTFHLLEDNSTTDEPQTVFQSINAIFQEEIIGGDNSPSSKLIQELENSDWVKKGLDYIDLEKEKRCPFCQEPTLTEQLVDNIKKVFDESYARKAQLIQNTLAAYKEFNDSLSMESYKKDFLEEEQASRIEITLNKVRDILNQNINTANEKVQNPSHPLELLDHDEAIVKFNELIEEINEGIGSFNERLKHKKQEIEKLKAEFWNFLRNQYDHDIKLYERDKKELDAEKTRIENELKDLQALSSENNNKIDEVQNSVTSIGGVIDKINKHLRDFGISDFSIIRHDEENYRIQRVEGIEDNDTFRTLSEGEKTAISFLYFIELCKEQGGESGSQRKIVVIDDPISSLSHIHIYNVASLIKTTFLEKGDSESFLQVFILTHSLYFFNELLNKKFTNDENRELFRIYKERFSCIETMEPNEIQNEYQAYWSIIKNKRKDNKFVVANAMRNVIEYFFAFIDNSENITEIFKKPELKSNRYKAFERYIQRESHSDSPNIYDHKEFDIPMFLEAFEGVFKATGYEKHYEKMMGQS